MGQPDCGNADAPPEYCRWGLPHPHCDMELYDPKCVRVKFHHVNNTGGPVSPMTDAFFVQLLDDLNEAFAPAKIGFTLENECVHRVNKDVPLVNGAGNPIGTALGLGTLLIDTEGDGSLLPNPDEDLAYEPGFINIYFVQNFTGAASAWRLSSLAVFGRSNYNFGLFVHEVGHTLGLDHTYRGSSDLTCSCKNEGAVNPTTNILHCLTVHDCICDTGLDPYGLNLDGDQLPDGTKWVDLINCTQLSTLSPGVADGCEDVTTAWDIPFRNYMGYYAECRSEFTPCQMALMHDILEELESDLVTTGCMEICDNDIEIKTVELWENQTIELCQGQNIIISEDGILTIRNCTLTVSEPLVSPNSQCPDLYPEVFWGGIFITGKSVNVQPGGVEVGGKLRIENSVMEYAWNGIKVTDQFGSISIHDSKIQKCGRILDVNESWPALPPSNGNDLAGNSTTGRDNEGNIDPCAGIGIYNPAPIIQLANVTITVDDMVTLEPRPESQIRVVGAPLSISNGEIENLTSDEFTAISHSRGRLAITNTTVIKGFLNGVNKGIDLTYPCSSRGLVIRNSSFLDGSIVENQSAYLVLTGNYFESRVRSNGLSYQYIYRNHFKDQGMDIDQPIVSSIIRENYFNKAILGFIGDNSHTLPTCNEWSSIPFVPAIEITSNALLNASWGRKDYATGNRRPVNSDPLPLIFRYGNSQPPCIHHTTDFELDQFDYEGQIFGDVITSENLNTCQYGEWPPESYFNDTIVVEEISLEYNSNKYDSLEQYITGLFDQLEGLTGQEAEWVIQEIRYNEILQRNLIGEVLGNLTLFDTTEYDLWIGRGHEKIETISTIYHLWNQGSFYDIKEMMVSDTSSDGAVFYSVLDWLDNMSVDQELLYRLNDELIDSLIDFAITSFGDYTNILRSFLLAEYDVFIPWPDRVPETQSFAQLTSIEAEKENNIIIFPNPTHACFQIISAAPHIQLYDIVVTSFDGRIIYHSTVVDERKICLEMIPPGFYIVRINDTERNRIISTKLIIK